MTTKALRTDVLRLYRACLRSARKCPEWEKREMMKTYVRMKFRDEVSTRDTTRIHRLLTEGREELEQMEYYHSVYEEKQRQRAAAMKAGAFSAGSSKATATGASRDAVGALQFTNANCPGCGCTYVPAEAKFCSSCGSKRV